MNYALLGRQWTPYEIANVVFDADPRLQEWQGINCIAVALGESGGYEAAIHLNDSNPTAASYLSLDLGMWQINTFYYPQFSAKTLFTPALQLKLAVVPIAQPPAGKWAFNWNPWLTWSKGYARLTKYQAPARTALNQVRAERGLPLL